MTYEELEQKVKRLEEQLTEVRIELLERKADKKTYEVEVPGDIGNYYYVSELGDIDLVENVFCDFDYKGVYQRGLAFKTEEEAEQFDKERILLFKLHKWAEEHNGGWKPNWKDDEIKYYITDEYDRFKIDYTVCYRMFIKLPYFKSEELAEQFIEEFGDEIKEVFC